PCQSVADRHQGYRPSGRGRLQRADAGNTPGRWQHQGLFHLFHGGRRSLSAADAVFQRDYRPRRTLVAARHALHFRRALMRKLLRLAMQIPPHRAGLLATALALVMAAAIFMRWDWLPNYYGLALAGLWRTIWILVVTCVLGFMMAVPLGLAQAAG